MNSKGQKQFGKGNVGRTKESCPFEGGKGVLLVQLRADDNKLDLSGLKVHLSGRGNPAPATTNSVGLATFPPLQPGKYAIDCPDLAVRFAGCQVAPATGNVAAEDLDTTYVDVKTQGSVLLQVVRADRDSEGVDDVKVKLAGQSATVEQPDQGQGLVNFKALPAGTYQATITLGNEAKARYIAPRQAVEVTITAGKGGARKLPIEARKLALTTLSPDFAPGAGDLEIKFDSAGLEAAEVKLRVRTTKHNPQLVFERALTADEIQNHVIKWDGKTSCGGGDLRDKSVDPGHGPYQVSLYATDVLQSEKELEVLGLLRLQVKRGKDAFASKPYELERDGRKVTGNTDGQGWIKEKIPKGVAAARLVIDGEAYDLELGKLHPASTVSGQKERLQRAGFFAGAIDDQADDAFKQAVKAFQLAHGAEPKGDVDGNTEQLLVESAAS